MMKNTIIEEFSSLSQLISELSRRDNNQVMRNEHSSQKKGDSWAGTNTYEEAVKYILGGYEKPLDALKRGVITANTKSTSPRRCRPMNDIIGYVPNVPAAVIGLPQSMIRQGIEPKKSKIINIIYSPDANFMTSSETIEKAGIAVLSLINNLEKNGYRIALSIAFYVGEKNNEEAIAMVKVKDWRQPIDLKKIAFPICNSGMLRRFGFKWLETCKGLQESGWAGGYGRTPKYGRAVNILKSNKMLSDTEYFINVEICEEQNFDIDKITQRIGMSQLSWSK
jgi:hypothetical protein